MSGGVDSSAAAAILVRENNNVVGVTMKIWDGQGKDPRPGGCCSIDDTDDARRVCENLGIPHYTLNAKEAFKADVVDYFVSQYYAGMTPNPCIPCNQALKFGYLFQQGEKFGATKVATGHYARIEAFMGRKVIARAVDEEKDQSYYLFSIDPSRLDNIEFPLGSYTKEMTRKLASELSLPVAQKPESQEICFVPDNDYKSFIRRASGAGQAGEGDIVDSSGAVIGRHTGYTDYTVGQRKGLGIAAPAPMYVLSVDPGSNKVTAGFKEDLYSNNLLAGGANWFIPPEDFSKLDLTSKIRSRGKDSQAKVGVLDDGRFTVEFKDPQLAITPGQAVVIYHQDYVIGGGWIEKSL